MLSLLYFFVVQEVAFNEHQTQRMLDIHITPPLNSLHAGRSSAEMCSSLPPPPKKNRTMSFEVLKEHIAVIMGLFKTTPENSENGLLLLKLPLPKDTNILFA